MRWKTCALMVLCLLSPPIGARATATPEPADEASHGNASSQQVATKADLKSSQGVTAAQMAMKNPRLQAAISQHVHPNARIVSLESLNRLSRDKFLQEVDEGSPGFVTGDFNGDGVPDYAALLIFPQKKTSGEWLVVFIGSKNGGFQLRLLEKYTGVHDDIYITMQPVLEVKPLHSARRVKLRGPGIARIHPDRRPTLFYWGEGRFQRTSLPAPQSIAASLSVMH